MFSYQWEYRSSVSLMHLFVEFRFFNLLQHVTAWGSWVYIVLELTIGSCCGLVACSFAVSPGTWPGGAWVPGGPRPGLFVFAVAFHPWSKSFLSYYIGALSSLWAGVSRCSWWMSSFVCLNFHQDVSRLTVHKGLRPNSRIMYRFFTSHQPMMNEQDQVTWTNWPASKKK